LEHGAAILYLVASDESPEMITRYFQQKGFSTILSYKDMIL
jgi:hypothetical protein